MSENKSKKLPELASSREFAEFFETHDISECELEETHFDYTKAKPNRFVVQSRKDGERKRLEENTRSDRETGN